jgi:2'-phosphotransferase
MSFLTQIELEGYSRFIIKLLRHDALKYNLFMDCDGFIKCDELLAIPEFKIVSIEDIKKIVTMSESDKKRFNLKNVQENYYIAANQGHSININSSLLKPITLENYYEYENKDIIHGSFLRAKDKILKQGLNKMKRIHIHFTTNIDPNKVISGLRKSCEIYIYINLEKALQDGYEFFESPNGVILCPGNSMGVLPTEYFLKVVNKKDLTKL